MEIEAFSACNGVTWYRVFAMGSLPDDLRHFPGSAEDRRGKAGKVGVVVGAAVARLEGDEAAAPVVVIIESTAEVVVRSLETEGVQPLRDEYAPFRGADSLLCRYEATKAVGEVRIARCCVARGSAGRCSARGGAGRRRDKTRDRGNGGRVARTHGQ